MTEVVGLDPNRLYPSIYENDEEAFHIWHDEMGIPEERIFRFGKEDNFWDIWFRSMWSVFRNLL